MLEQCLWTGAHRPFNTAQGPKGPNYRVPRASWLEILVLILVLNRLIAFECMAFWNLV